MGCSQPNNEDHQRPLHADLVITESGTLDTIAVDAVEITSEYEIDFSEIASYEFDFTGVVSFFVLPMTYLGDSTNKAFYVTMYFPEINRYRTHNMNWYRGEGEEYYGTCKMFFHTFNGNAQGSYPIQVLGLDAVGDTSVSQIMMVNLELNSIDIPMDAPTFIPSVFDGENIFRYAYHLIVDAEDNCRGLDPPDGKLCQPMMLALQYWDGSDRYGPFSLYTFNDVETFIPFSEFRNSSFLYLVKGLE